MTGITANGILDGAKLMMTVQEPGLPEDPLEIRGPTFLMYPESDPTPFRVTYDSTRWKVVLHSMIKGDDEETDLLDRTRAKVSQVWVTTRVAGSPTITFGQVLERGSFCPVTSMDLSLLIEFNLSGGMVTFVNGISASTRSQGAHYNCAGTARRRAFVRDSGWGSSTSTNKRLTQRKRRCSR